MATPRQEVALDLSKLMDSVRADVRRLMDEAVEHTANYCATLCAERIVAARRDMRRDLKRQFYTPRSPHAPPSPAASVARLALAPLSALSALSALSPSRASPRERAHCESELVSTNHSVAQLEERSTSAMQALKKLEEAVQAADGLTRTPGTPHLSLELRCDSRRSCTPPAATPTHGAASPHADAAWPDAQEFPERQNGKASEAKGFESFTVQAALDVPHRTVDRQAHGSHRREKSVESSVAPSLTGEDLAGC